MTARLLPNLMFLALGLIPILVSCCSEPRRPSFSDDGVRAPESTKRFDSRNPLRTVRPASVHSVSISRSSAYNVKDVPASGFVTITDRQVVEEVFSSLRGKDFGDLKVLTLLPYRIVQFRARDGSLISSFRYSPCGLTKPHVFEFITPEPPNQRVMLPPNYNARFLTVDVPDFDVLVADYLDVYETKDGGGPTN